MNEEWINHVQGEFLKDNSIIKENQDAYRSEYYRQLLFVSATLLGILVALGPKQEEASALSYICTMLSELLLGISSLLTIVLLRIQLLTLHKFRNRVSQFYQQKLHGIFPEFDYMTIKQPFLFGTIEWLATYSFFLAIVLLMVPVAIRLWEKISLLLV